MNNKAQPTFALLFTSRSNFPKNLIQAARQELIESLQQNGYQWISPEYPANHSGAVETQQDGSIAADFLREKAGGYQGVIICLPNFGSEAGVIRAVRDVNVPILIHAYPDDLDRLSTATRRDAFCGKFAMLNVLKQSDIPFTNPEPHVIHPRDSGFSSYIDYFAKVCRIVNKLRSLTVGAIGARTTPFKAVRYDEVAMQKHHTTVETIDLSEVFSRVSGLSFDDKSVKSKIEHLRTYADWNGTPAEALNTMGKLGVVIDQIIEEYQLDAIALRCWTEIQKELQISPCVLMGELNDRGICAACEVDVSSAVAMAAIGAASETPATVMDWNNNYGGSPDKCIVFHCGPAPRALMAEKGCISDHELLVADLGAGCSFGCNVGRLKEMELTYCGLKTENGRIQTYLGEARISDDSIPKDFFGCSGVLVSEGLQSSIRTIGNLGYRHHVTMTEGSHTAALNEAFENYLGFEVQIV